MNFQRVVNQAVELQAQLPWLEMVVVGGTAAALHASHRFSTAADQVTALLRSRFQIVREKLDHWEGWKTNRLRPPVLILGERHEVELGIRQLRRTIDLQTTTVQGLLVPTPAETLRIKAFLCTERRMMRDYLDVAALADLLGEDGAKDALAPLNLLYEPRGNQTRLTAFAQTAFEVPPDFDPAVLASYKGLRAPYTDWNHVSGVCRTLGAAMAQRELEGRLPEQLPEGFRRVDETREEGTEGHGC